MAAEVAGGMSTAIATEGEKRRFPTNLERNAGVLVARDRRECVARQAAAERDAATTRISQLESLLAEQAGTTPPECVYLVVPTNVLGRVRAFVEILIVQRQLATLFDIGFHSGIDASCTHTGRATSTRRSWTASWKCIGVAILLVTTASTRPST